MAKINIRMHVSHSDMSNDCEHLIATFEKLKISETKRPTVISTPYPGAFYRKTVDDGKIKVFQRGDDTKIWMYPKFHPRCSRQGKEDDQ
jgi:hypothetical protein